MGRTYLIYPLTSRGNFFLHDANKIFKVLLDFQAPLKLFNYFLSHCCDSFIEGELFRATCFWRGVKNSRCVVFALLENGLIVDLVILAS